MMFSNNSGTSADSRDLAGVMLPRRKFITIKDWIWGISLATGTSTIIT